jgi:hypothetical protein
MYENASADDIPSCGRNYPRLYYGPVKYLDSLPRTIKIYRNGYIGVATRYSSDYRGSIISRGKMILLYSFQTSSKVLRASAIGYRDCFPRGNAGGA